MPFLGAHMSIAGGLHLAFERLHRVGGKALQIFSKNQRQWGSPSIGLEAVALFQRHWEESGRIPVAVHSSYLINLAEPEPVKAERAVLAFADEIARASLLCIPFVVIHPGSHLGQGVEQGLDHCVRNLDRAIEAAGRSDVMVLIETTAGQGSGLGSTFEEIAYILHNSRNTRLLGVCFDTCHTFAVGYDIHSPDAYNRTFSVFDELVGLDRLKLFHLNDSKKGRGARIDRHEHIGKGEIGIEGFRLLLNDPRFNQHPMVLETPKGKGLSNDLRNLGVLRSLLKKPSAARRSTGK